MTRKLMPAAAAGLVQIERGLRAVATFHRALLDDADAHVRRRWSAQDESWFGKSGLRQHLRFSDAVFNITLTFFQIEHLGLTSENGLLLVVQAHNQTMLRYEEDAAFRDRHRRPRGYFRKAMISEAQVRNLIAINDSRSNIEDGGRFRFNRKVFCRLLAASHSETACENALDALAYADLLHTERNQDERSHIVRASDALLSHFERHLVALVEPS